MKDDSQTLSAKFLAHGKASFESAASLFLMGLATDRGLLPSLEPNAFEPKLIAAVEDLRNDGYRIQLNQSRFSARSAATQATSLLAFENIIVNDSGL